MTLLGISGSLRASSTNTALLKSILQGDGFEPGVRFHPEQVSIFAGIGELPYYNTELDTADAPATVSHWRTALSEASAIIICTPEYAFGIPGVLKNALDWLASSGELVDKPVLAVSASPGYTGGNKAHASLLLTLKALSAQVIQPGSCCVPAVKQKLNEQGQLVDADVIAELSLGLSKIKEITRS